MTVSYNYAVATSGFGCFIKLFARFRASIYKLIWRDLFIYMIIYFLIHMIYQCVVDDNTQREFEKVVHYCKSSSSLIPVTFVLGFFVSIIVTRWWNQYLCLPWPDPIAVLVSALIHGNDDRGRIMRRTIVRYVCTCSTMLFCLIAPAVKKRFPTLDKLVEFGLLMENEKLIIENINSKFPKYPKHWMPIVWASAIVTRARQEGRVRDDFAMKSIIDYLNAFRDMCNRLIHYDTIGIPLLYTQVVTLVVYTYFVGALIGQQWTLQKKDLSDIAYVAHYIPVFLILEFVFYMGWLKVAECLICPFGEDDDDFELNWFLDRNLKISYLVVDDMHHEHPQLIRDQYWDEIFPAELPYPLDISLQRDEPPIPSTGLLNMTKEISLNDIRNTDPMHYYWRRVGSLRYSSSYLSGEDDQDIEKGTHYDKMRKFDIDKHRYDPISYIDLTRSEISLVYMRGSEQGSSVEEESKYPKDFDELKNQRLYERNLRQRKRMLQAIDIAVSVELAMQAKKTADKFKRLSSEEEI